MLDYNIKQEPIRGLLGMGGGVSFGSSVGGDSNPGVTDPIITDGLVMWLDASVSYSYDGTGNVWRDLTSNGNDVTSGSTPTWNSSGYFTNVGGGFSKSSSTNTPTGGSAYTLTAWVNISNWSNRYGLIGIGSGSSMNQFRSGDNPNGGMTNYWNGDDLITTTVAQNNTWTMVTATYDGGTRRIYANTTQGSSTNSSTSLNVSNSILNVARTAFGEVFSGSFAIAGIYNRAISVSEITTNFNALRTKFGV
jgi:hypothetical protein